MTTETTTTTAAPAATTPASSAPAVNAYSSATSSTAATETTTTAATETTTTEDDMSWFPKKYLDKEGKPDYQKLANGYRNLEKRFGNKDVLPPITPDGYEYTLESDNLVVDEERMTALKQAAMEQGLSPSQFKWAMDIHVAKLSEITPTEEKAATTLKSVWKDEETFNVNMNNAGKAWDVFAPSDLNLSEHPELGNNPVLIQLLARIGAELGEDNRPLRGNGGGHPDILPPEKLAELRAREDRYSNPEIADQIKRHYQAIHKE